MSYPRSMYKGNPDKPTELVVHNEDEEKAAHKDGFVDGHTFYSKDADPEVTEEVVDDSTGEIHEVHGHKKHAKKKSA